MPDILLNINHKYYAVMQYIHNDAGNEIDSQWRVHEMYASSARCNLGIHITYANTHYIPSLDCIQRRPCYVYDKKETQKYKRQSWSEAGILVLVCAEKTLIRKWPFRVRFIAESKFALKMKALDISNSQYHPHRCQDQDYINFLLKWSTIYSFNSVEYV